MEVTRIDPYLARWSSDSVLALATMQVGLQFLIPDAAPLLAERSVKFHRVRATNLPDGRIIDMQWSQAFVAPSSGCLLACVLDTGCVVVLESGVSETSVLYTLDGDYSAVTWAGDLLVLGETNGNVSGYAGVDRRFATTVSNLPVTHLASSATYQIGAVLSDNSAWTLNKNSWTQVEKPSRFCVTSVAYGERLITLRCGKVGVHKKLLPLESCLPGHLFLMSQNKIIVIHADGHRSNLGHAEDVPLPQIQGGVLFAQAHPKLPMGIVILNTGSWGDDGVHHGEWKFPILSSQNIAIYLFPLPGDLGIPRRSEYDTTSAWLQYTVSSKSVQPHLAETLVQPNIDVSKPLNDQLRELFLSELFDGLRWEWFTSDRKQAVVQRMRGLIAEVLRKTAPVSPIDRLVVSLYNGNNSSFVLEGDFIEDSFGKQPNDGTVVVKSENGRIWNQCALTLLPILSMQCRRSAAGGFSALTSSPSKLGGKSSGPNVVTDALLQAGTFCIYNGVRWV